MQIVAPVGHCCLCCMHFTNFQFEYRWCSQIGLNLWSLVRFRSFKKLLSSWTTVTAEINRCTWVSEKSRYMDLELLSGNPQLEGINNLYCTNGNEWDPHALILNKNIIYYSYVDHAKNMRKIKIFCPEEKRTLPSMRSVKICGICIDRLGA